MPEDVPNSLLYIGLRVSTGIQHLIRFFLVVFLQNQSTSRWSVVKDDFMIGKQKLKDWDKVSLL